jgi:sulfur relay (sulfurtransferase) DsrC/TusE family protein
MYNITKSINNPHLDEVDPHGNMYALNHWSPRMANQIAAQDGMVLEDTHWQVIYCLRELFRASSGKWTARRLTQRMGG